MGVNERETNADINTAPATTTPNSRNNLPTKPSKNMMGKNTTAKVIEVESTAKKISFEPLIAASRGLIPSSIFLKIFSVTTMPSSTTKPVASTIANRVNILIEKPNMYMIKNAPINETGISISGRNAISQSRKNRKIINTTNKNAIKRVSPTSVIDLRINFVLSSAISSLISLGTSFFI